LVQYSINHSSLKNIKYLNDYLFYFKHIKLMEKKTLLILFLSLTLLNNFI